jgi:hypothetical protein
LGKGDGLFIHAPYSPKLALEHSTVENSLLCSHPLRRPADKNYQPGIATQQA